MGLLNYLKSMGSQETATCQHLESSGGSRAKARAGVCEECGEKRSLRFCLTCGHVGCCDSLSGHATVHVQETGHPVVQSISAVSFTYCYQGHGYL